MAQTDTMTKVSENTRRTEGDTVVDDKLAEHELKRSWTLWFDTPMQNMKPAWFDNVSKVNTFKTVEDFWRLYNNVETPSLLKLRSNYYLFAKDIQPMWEDSSNEKGGKWVIEVSPGNSDSAWLYCVLGVVGESIECSEQICGIIYGVRNKKHKLSIWTSDADDEEACVAIARSIKEILKISNTIHFYPHDSYAKKGKTFKGADKPLYSC